MDLKDEFKEKLDKTLAQLKSEGYIFKPYQLVRTPFEQAILWRQSRKKSEVDGKIADLKSQGASFLAHCIESVGPRSGPFTTNAIGGLSWHQFGEAADCYLVKDGKADWNNEKAYLHYRDVAIQNGLFQGPKFELNHVQFQKHSSPLKIYSLQEIDKIMKKHFG